MTISTLVVVGDSLAKGDAGGTSYGGGGTGSWVEHVSDTLANWQTLGPLISSGIRLPLSQETVLTGTWTQVGANAAAKAPYGLSYQARGINNIYTFTLPAQWRQTVVGFALYWVDYSSFNSTSAGNWQYRIDGGTWTNMGQNIVHDDTVNKFYVPSPVTQKVEIRAYDGTADCGCLPVGVEVFYTDPRVANIQGLIVHNWGSGGEYLNNLTNNTAPSDGMALLDSVKLGTGSPVSSTPNLGVLMIHINDATGSFGGNATLWATDLTELYNRAHPLGPVGFISPWECAGSVTNQTTFRATTKSTAAGFSPPAQVLDFYDYYAARGWTGMTAVLNAGLTLEGTHPTQLGHTLIGERVSWWIRETISPNAIGVDSRQFTVGQSALGSTDMLAGTPGATVVVSPPTVTVPTTIPAVTILAVVPVATVNTVTTVPAPAVSGGALVTATPVNVVTTVAAMTFVANATVIPTSVNVITSVGATNITATATVVAAVVNATATIYAATVTNTATVVAAVVTCTAAIPPPTVHTDTTLSVGTVNGTVTIPAPTVSSSATVLPARVAVVITVPTATASASDVNVAATAVVVAVAVPVATISVSSLVSPGAVNATVTIPAVTVTTSARVVAAAVTVRVAIPAAALDQTVHPPTVTVLIETLDASVVTGVVIPFRPTSAIPTNSGSTTAEPVNDGHTIAEKRMR